MMRLSRRRVALSLALFLGLVALGAWPWPRVALAFSAVYSPLANVALSSHTFGGRGHARLIPLEEIRRQESDNVTADTLLSLTIDGFKGALPLGISLRRDVYLPLLILIALLAAAPLQIRRRLTCLAVAMPIAIGAGIAANLLVATWTFMFQVRGIYSPSAFERLATDLAYGALLSPPGNRFIGPLGLGAGLVAWQALQLRTPSARPAFDGDGS